MHVRVAVPEPCRVVRSSAQVVPEGAETESVTVPAKPWTGEIVIVDVDDWPAVAEAGGVEVMVKSEVWKVNVVVA